MMPTRRISKKYGKETFKADYKKLIAKFQALSTKPDIYICTPPPMYYGDGGFQVHLMTM